MYVKPWYNTQKEKPEMSFQFPFNLHMMFLQQIKCQVMQ